MKIQLLTLTILAAFILSITFSTYSQSDTKKIDKKVQTINEKKAPQKEPKPLMKKIGKKEKVAGEEKTIEKKDMKTMQKMKTSNKVNKKAGTSKTVEKK